MNYVFGKFGQSEPTGALGVATGFAKGAVETMKGTLNLAGKAVGKQGAGDEALQGFGGQPLDTEAKNTSQTIGKVGESILEFISGDEALKGLSLAARFANAGPIARCSKAPPRWRKSLTLARLLCGKAQ